MRRRITLPLALLGTAGLAVLLPACSFQDGGNFTLLGYSTAPNYCDDVKTVRVPVFDNKTYRQGVEFELTQAVVEAIERYTPYKVRNCDGQADTELKGTITAFSRQLTLPSPLNETRQAEAIMLVEVVWKDLRTGEERSRPARRPGEAPRPEGPGTPPLPEPLIPRLAIPQTPTPPSSPAVAAPGAAPSPSDLIVLPGQPDEPPKPTPVQVRVSSLFIPELAQSFGSAQADCCRKAALHIVHLMEKGW
jgi:hypothetical protein